VPTLFKLLWIVLSGGTLSLIGAKAIKERSIEIGLLAGHLGGARPLFNFKVIGAAAIVIGVIFISSGVNALIAIMLSIFNVDFNIDIMLNISIALLIGGVFSGMLIHLMTASTRLILNAMRK
jgi:hypothetical protein